MQLSIFWRLVITSLIIITVMGGVNIYALFQLRQLTAMSTQMASYHYPAAESAKRLLGSLYAQLNSEKKYLATRDRAFLTNLTEEVDEFERNLQLLRGRESSSQGLTLLQKTDELLKERLKLFQDEFETTKRKIRQITPEYEHRRDGLMDRMSASIQSYIDLHEARVSVGVTESRASAAQAEAVTEQLVLVALVFGVGLAGIASYTILRPLRQLQGHIKQIGQGNLGASLQINAPAELRELV
ncbi:MAG: HAMP domain-containing protein, partial [Nitrospira sp.]|nr:HAMP domain-containing protein [Nitrospira sp.]